MNSTFAELSFEMRIVLLLNWSALPFATEAGRATT